MVVEFLVLLHQALKSEFIPLQQLRACDSKANLQKALYNELIILSRTLEPYRNPCTSNSQQIVYTSSMIYTSRVLYHIQPHQRAPNLQNSSITTI